MHVPQPRASDAASLWQTVRRRRTYVQEVSKLSTGHTLNRSPMKLEIEAIKWA